jgi:DNA/RNA-binding domain of Phe-tRNA-synthetase-like protein
MQFALAPELTAIVQPGVLWLEGATVVEDDPGLLIVAADLEAHFRDRDHSSLQAQIDAIRTMYKRVGIDPTRRRPSSEAMLRRVTRGDSFPRVNSMVDVCNWCSLEFQLPYGLYDSDLIEGDVTLRIGLPGETYAGIRKDDVNVGGRIALADARGPFGNPTSDSARTMITTATRNALLVVFAPRGTAAARLETVLDVTAQRMQEYTGARTARRVCL